MALKVFGFKELDRKLKQLPERLRKEKMTGILLEAAEPIKAAMETLAPVRTGKLKRNIIIVEVQSEKPTVKVGASKEIFYAHLVEFGTSHSAAHPFVRPGFDAAKDAAVRRISDSIKKEITG